MSKEDVIREMMKNRFKQLEKVFDDFPDPPPCEKCGRLIFCGVNKLCSDKECPKKTVKLDKK